MATALQNHPFWDEISAFVNSEMVTQQIPALLLAVLQSGKLLFAQGYGLVNLELAVKANARTVYGLASISRTFAATALMLLVADGECNVIEQLIKIQPALSAVYIL